MAELFVESFAVDEVKNEHPEIAEEAIALAESLGLDGQSAFARKKEDGDDSAVSTRVPYREILTDEEFAYKVICPKSVSVSDYKTSPIPLRVLQILEHAKSLDFFESFHIWDKESASEKDPVLVGIHKEPIYHVKDGKREVYYHNSKTYILARWGEELETFAVLLERATNLCRASKVDALERALNKWKHMSNSEVVGEGNGTVYI